MYGHACFCLVGARLDGYRQTTPVVWPKVSLDRSAKTVILAVLFGKYCKELIIHVHVYQQPI